MRQIKGYPDYFVDREGNVYRQRGREINKLNPFPSSELNPDPRVSIYANGILKKAYVKQLVYEAYVEDIPRGGIVFSIDGNCSNVAVDNLSLTTKRDISHTTPPTNVPVKMYRNGEYWGIAETKAQCACILGISRGSVDNILKGHMTFRRCYLECTNNSFKLWFNGSCVDKGKSEHFLNKYNITPKIFDKQLTKFNYFQKEWRICIS